MKRSFKTILFSAVLLPLLTSAAITIDGTTTNVKEQKVYICTGPQSKRFHCTAQCRGLGSCSKKVIAVPFSKAKTMGRTPCGWCYD